MGVRRQQASGDLVQHGLRGTRRQRVAEYANYDPLHIRIEDRYWGTESKRQDSGSAIVPQAWDLQQTCEVARNITVESGKQPSSEAFQRTGPLALQADTSQELDQVFL